MITQHSVRCRIVSEPTHRRHPVARLLGPLHTSQQLPAPQVVSMLLVTVALLSGACWSSPGIIWGNGSTPIAVPLPPPAATAGKAAWLHYYGSYDLILPREVIASVYAPAPAPTIAVVRAPAPQPRALPVDPTRRVTASVPIATPPPIPAAQTR